MADGAPKMVFLGFGKFARADKIYALEPLTGDDRGDGRRTRVWVEGIAEPIVASRTERSILGEMGIRDAGRVQILDDAVIADHEGPRSERREHRRQRVRVRAPDGGGDRVLQQTAPAGRMFDSHGLLGKMRRARARMRRSAATVR